MLRRSIQKFFARALGERDYHLYEAVPLGLQLPQVIPLLPVASLPTSGHRALKSAAHLKDKGEEEPVTWDSKIDHFDKRLSIVRKQRELGDLSIAEEEIRDVSLYEFYWKFYVKNKKVRRSASTPCLMVTPSFGADCANVEHAVHEAYARAAVVAYWRHMPAAERRAMIMGQTEVHRTPQCCIGGTRFEVPF